jgi:hypothetical protein
MPNELKPCRDRLIELIKNARKNTKGANCDIERNMLFADHLLANGVIVPTVKKIGEKLYFHQFDNKFEKVVVEGEIIKIANDEREYVVKLNDGRKLIFPASFLGQTVFLTKEDAEKALKEPDQ